LFKCHFDIGTRKNNVSIEPVIYRIIEEMLANYKNNTIPVKDIWDHLVNNLSGVYDPDKKPNEFQSFDHETIYRNMITKILEGFGAERNHKKSGNVLIFDPEKLKIGRMYPIDIEREVNENRAEDLAGDLVHSIILDTFGAEYYHVVVDPRDIQERNEN
jgi:hypothetical protein